MRNYVHIFIATLLLAGCASIEPGKSDTAMTTSESQVAPSVDIADTGNAAVAAQGVTESARVAEQQGLQDKSVYFDFDSFVVKQEYRTLLLQHVEILKEHPQDAVTLEGNADERGSPEYNLALGSKRAVAVRNQMVLLGIAKSRMNEMSYGEEKPRASCHEESCWQQNRRVDFSYRSRGQ